MAGWVVVYFDQRLGAAHPKHWSKFTTLGEQTGRALYASRDPVYNPEL